MRELESSLQEFGEFLLKAQLARQTAAPYFVRWVRRFLSRPASDEPLTDQVRGFCEELERGGASEEWQVRQADQALRIYSVSFLKRTDWHQPPASTVVDEQGSTSPLAALEQLRMRVRTRHYSYRTECTYVDWVRRFLHYAGEQQGVPHPRVESEIVRDYLTHLAVRDQVSASTQNQALCAILFLCRDVLGVNVEGVSPGVRAKRGERLPVVLSMPETAALLSAMTGTPRLMAALIYGGGLRVSECCELRVKDLDFDQGLVIVRRAKGDKDRSHCSRRWGGRTYVPTCAGPRPSTRPTAGPGSPASGCPTLWTASTRMQAGSSPGSGLCTRPATSSRSASADTCLATSTEAANQCASANPGSRLNVRLASRSRSSPQLAADSRK